MNLKFLLLASMVSAVCYGDIPKIIPHQVVLERDHSTSVFTQGLVIRKGYFFESGGLYGDSMLVSYPVDDESGGNWLRPFTNSIELESRFFGEGLTLLKNRLYQLTWKEKTILVYEPNTLALISSHEIEGDGWGLTTDGKHLIKSDGTSTISYLDSVTFEPIKTIEVTLNGLPQLNINELEYIEGFIFANIWHDNRILKIDPGTGAVVGIVDLSNIAQRIDTSAERVLNGIAYDSERGTIWVTGKKWPKMFQIRLLD